MNQDVRRYLAERAQRQPRSAEHAAERAHRGAQLCRDILAGKPALERPAPAPADPPARVEFVACSGCYTPILAAPGSRCPACEPREPETPDA